MGKLVYWEHSQNLGWGALGNLTNNLSKNMYLHHKGSKSRKE